MRVKIVEEYSFPMEKTVYRIYTKTWLLSPWLYQGTVYEGFLQAQAVATSLKDHKTVEI